MLFRGAAVTKIPGISSSTTTYDIARAAIVGAGTMGGGIAMAFVNAGIPVLIERPRRRSTVAWRTSPQLCALPRKPRNRSCDDHSATLTVSIKPISSSKRCSKISP